MVDHATLKLFRVVAEEGIGNAGVIDDSTVDAIIIPGSNFNELKEQVEFFVGGGELPDFDQVGARLAGRVSHRWAQNI